MEGVCVCVVKAFLAQKPRAHGGFGFGLSFALAHMCDRRGVGLRAHCVKVMDRLAASRTRSWTLVRQHLRPLLGSPFASSGTPSAPAPE